MYINLYACSELVRTEVLGRAQERIDEHQERLPGVQLAYDVTLAHELMDVEREAIRHASRSGQIGREATKRALSALVPC